MNQGQKGILAICGSYMIRQLLSGVSRSIIIVLSEFRSASLVHSNGNLVFTVLSLELLHNKVKVA